MESVKMKDACIHLEGDNLILENSEIYREIDLAGNVLATISLRNLRTGKEWVRRDDRYAPQMAVDMSLSMDKPALAETHQSALSFAGNEEFMRLFPGTPRTRMEAITSTVTEQPHLVARVDFNAPELQFSRYYQIYPGCPATVCWSVLTGRIACSTLAPVAIDHRGRMLRKESRVRNPVNADLHDGLFLRDRHLRVRNVIFTDCTDYQDNYMQEEERYSFTTFHPWMLAGNILFAENLVDREGLFLVKESPVLSDQPDHPDGDFIFAFDRGMLGQIGWGITPEELLRLKTMPSWRTVIGVYDATASAEKAAVKSYLRNHSHQKPGRDWLVMCNQWGEGNGPGTMSDSFVREEIDACSRLGIPAYMLDAGWQRGDFNAVHDILPDGSSPFYDHGNFWEVNSKRFPKGLDDVMAYARSKGVKIQFWFNPDPTDENANYAKDAETILNLNRKYGADVFKIDGVWNITRRADLNNRAFLEKVIEESKGVIAFQLDITNGARWGFLYAHHIGVLFCENRYAKYHSYLPYRVHKNLWALAHYLMPQRLQFEFINNSPSKGTLHQPVYALDDPFTPEKYPIEYCFAVVMFSNPLAWMEPSLLSQEQIGRLAPVIKKYNEIRDELFSGDIYPIGEKPSGRSITGFQSYNEKTGTGFVCAYREVTDRPGIVMKLHRIPYSQKMVFNLLMGKGTVVSKNDGYYFTLPELRSFALWKYEG